MYISFLARGIFNILFVEHYLEKVKEELPEPDFDIEDIMK